MRKEWRVKDCHQEYRVTLADEDPRCFVRDFCERWEGSKVVLLSQTLVLQQCGLPLIQMLEEKGKRVFTYELPEGEDAKSLQTVEAVWRFLIAHEVDRSTPLLAIGGGSVTDAAGFIAATYHRGLPLVSVPTTLLGQIDSSIGSKTGINFDQTKNNIGSFYSPESVYANVRFLNSLTPRHWSCGMAEMIKAGVIDDAELFSQLEQSDLPKLAKRSDELMELMARAIAVKIKLVGLDPWDRKKIRTKLNFGHTIGHAIESTGGFSQYTHGEAVALGMVWESKLAVLFGECRETEVARLEQLLLRYELPVSGSFQDAWLPYLMRDKKRVEKDLTFVFLRHIGQTIVKSVPMAGWFDKLQCIPNC